MDKVGIKSLEQQILKLEKILKLDADNIPLIEKMAFGLLCEEIQAIWWRSEESFNAMPSPLLQDEISLYAQHTWQGWRNDPQLLNHLSDSIKVYHRSGLLYQWDLDLHLQYPDLSLIKYWLASVSCCCRAPTINQADLWYKHLRLTQSLLIAQQQQALNPGCLVGYAEQNIIIISLEKRECAIISHQAFPTYQSSGITYFHYPYPL